MIATAIGVAIGLSTARLGLLASAVLTGQLTIGWLNDLVDAVDDDGRADKPLATGAATTRAVRLAFFVATALTVPLSLALGWSAGLLHLVAVIGGGWAYDLRLKRTAWSWLPYLVAFGALPAVVVLSLPGGPAPPWWGCVSGGLLGVGAHAANALPDIDRDRERGVGGLPARLGPAGTRWLAATSLLVATLVLAFAPAGPTGAAGWVAIGLAVLLMTGLGFRWTRHPRTPFVLVATVAVIDVALLVSRSDSWVQVG